MSKMIPAIVAGLFVVGYLATADFTPPAAMAEVAHDTYQAIWTPRASTDCQSWEIRQTDAALEDLWPHVDHMTIDDGLTEYGPNDVIDLRRDGDTFVFRFHAAGRQVYLVELEVVTTC